MTDECYLEVIELFIPRSQSILGVLLTVAGGPHRYEPVLSTVKLVCLGVVRKRQQRHGLGSQSRCPYRSNRWGKGKEDMGTGCLYSYRR
jgi:hypothetical protein